MRALPTIRHDPSVTDLVARPIQTDTSFDQIGVALATAVHDAMSPLSYIKGTAQQLRRLRASVDATELDARLATIESAVDRTAAALSVVLGIAGMPAEQPARGDRHVDLVALVRRLVQAEQSLARGHSIRMIDAPLTLDVPWDAGRLDRLLSNLIGNALKYSAPGTSVDVSLGLDQDNEGQWAVLTVADHGVGIPARDLPFVFEPRRRGSNVGAVAGSGLGLTSVWQIVRQCHGHLSVKSEEGRGTQVTVRLPLSIHAWPPRRA